MRKSLSPITLGTIHEIIQIIRQAGDIAMNRRHAARIQLKPDRTPFTDVELAMEALIIPFLQERFPTSQIISEENGVNGPPSGLVWALDPVDGTKVFLNGLPNWGISLGLLEDGKPRLGFFFMPVSGDFYWGGKGLGAFLNEIDLTTSKRLDLDDPLAFLAVTSNAHRHFDFDYPRVHSFGSTAAHLCYVAQGIAIGALTRRVNIWDLAGALPILDQSGIQVEFISRGNFSPEPFLNNGKLPEGLIAAHPGVMAAVRSGIHLK